MKREEKKGKIQRQQTKIIHKKEKQFSCTHFLIFINMALTLLLHYFIKVFFFAAAAFLLALVIIILISFHSFTVLWNNLRIWN
jgi:hypothetical protein